jgi:arginine exporter protein ArgO
MILLAGAVVSIIWLFIMEFYRGRLSRSGTVSLLLQFINPIVAILILIAAVILHFKMK